MSLLRTSCFLLTCFASACATDLELSTTESAARVAPLSCRFNPGGTSTPDRCISPDPERIDSVTFTAQTAFTGLLTFRGWTVRGPGGTGAIRLRGCRGRDTECEVVATPFCSDGPALPDGSPRLDVQQYVAGYSAFPISAIFTGEREVGGAQAVVLPIPCREQTAQVPAFPPIVLQCVMNGAPYSSGSSACSPNTARASNTIEFFIPSLPTSIPREFLQFEWDVLGATVLGGCGPTNHTCLISGPASNLGDRGFLAGVTAIDTRWNTWGNGSATATLPAVCGRQFC